MNQQSSQEPSRLVPWIGIAAILIAFQGIFTVAEISADPTDAKSWRRTRFGWEQANSLPVKPASASDSQPGDPSKVERTPISKNLRQVHNMLLPIGIAGFLSCFGTWCLTRYSEDEDFEA
jgi:hypothetical protein